MNLLKRAGYYEPYSKTRIAKARKISEMAEIEPEIKSAYLDYRAVKKSNHIPFGEFRVRYLEREGYTKYFEKV